MLYISIPNGESPMPNTYPFNYSSIVFGDFIEECVNAMNARNYALIFNHYSFILSLPTEITACSIVNTSFTTNSSVAGQTDTSSRGFLEFAGASSLWSRASLTLSEGRYCHGLD